MNTFKLKKKLRQLTVQLRLLTNGRRLAVGILNLAFFSFKIKIAVVRGTSVCRIVPYWIVAHKIAAF